PAQWLALASPSVSSEDGTANNTSAPIKTQSRWLRRVLLSIGFFLVAGFAFLGPWYWFSSNTRANRLERYAQILSAVQREQNKEKARARLDQCPEDLHGWEWQYLRNRLDRDANSCSLDPAAGSLTLFDFNRNGSLVALANAKSQELDVKILDLYSGRA